MLKKIISGGQTGADRAALDAAIELGIPHGGWIPKGRRTEEGPLPDKYELKEMATPSYEERTEQNVIDADGTLIVSHGQLTDGSAFTDEMAKKHDRPCLHIDLDVIRGISAAQKIKSWILQNGVKTLNVAGPRASKDPEIHDDTIRMVKGVYYLFQTIFICQCLQSYLQLLLLRFFFGLLFPFFVGQGVHYAPFNTLGLFFAFAHIAF